MAEGLTDDEQGSFRSRRRCVNQIFIVKQIGESVRRHERKSLRCMLVLWIQRRHVTRLKGKPYGRCSECMMWIGKYKMKLRVCMLQVKGVEVKFSRSIVK